MLLNWLLRPDQHVRELAELDYETLLSRGIRGVMLDLDNTLAPWHSKEIPDGVEAWIDGLRHSGLLPCMVTNSLHRDRVLPVAARLGIPSVLGAVKPFSSGFRRGMRLLGTTPKNTAMVGDMLLTDIFGAKRLGLYTVLVEPINLGREAWPATLIQRPLERIIGKALSLDRLAT